MQNRSHAVMSQRAEPKDSRDDFPTPPWATRALLEHVIIPRLGSVAALTCLEPGCGAGHMDRVLREYFAQTHAADAFTYGYGDTADFLGAGHAPGSFDWVVTNPPFRLAEGFIHKALHVARIGVAVIARTVFIEGVGRHEQLYRPRPPAFVAQFAERVPMVKGRLDRNASTATAYGWFVWTAVPVEQTTLVWIPKCRKELERDTDYPTDKEA